MSRAFAPPRRAARAVALALFAVAACSQRPGPPPGPPERVTVAYPRSMYSVLFEVARGKGLFAAEGLDVTGRPHEFGRLTVAEMLRGEADLAISGDTVAMFAIGRGDPLVILAETATSKRNQAVVARSDRGIASPADLVGRRIGVASGTTGQFFLAAFLAANRIDEGTVTLVDLTPTAMVLALEDGSVDAVATWQPYLDETVRRLGARAAVFFDERLYADIVCLTTTRTFARERPAAVRRVLRALLEAERAVARDPEGSQALVVTGLGVDPATAAQSWRDITFRVSLDQSLLVSLEDQHRWASHAGLLPPGEEPDFRSFIEVGALRDVRPEAVSIVR